MASAAALAVGSSPAAAPASASSMDASGALSTAPSSVRRSITCVRVGRWRVGYIADMPWPFPLCETWPPQHTCPTAAQAASAAQSGQPSCSSGAAAAGAVACAGGGVCRRRRRRWCTACSLRAGDSWHEGLWDATPPRLHGGLACPKAALLGARAGCRP